MRQDTLQARQQLVQLHQMLLETVRLEQWDIAATRLPLYLAASEQMMEAWQQASLPEEKAAIARLLQDTRIDQAEMLGRLRVRMHQLEEKMVQLQQGKSGCQHYAAQSPGRFD